MLHPGSRSKLTLRDLGRFPDDTLFHRVARTVCEAECLPRKELFESWEVARRVHRRLRGRRLLDLASGHGLVAHLLVLLDPAIEHALAVDPRLPESASRISRALSAAWPRLEGRITLVPAPLESVSIEPDDLVVSAHACGSLTDLVLDRALAARVPVAVLPCCHDARASDLGGLEGWFDDVGLAIDATRAARLRAGGYRVHTQRIPNEITPKNRLLFGAPAGP